MLADVVADDAIAAPQSFSVYFDKDSSQLSPTAKEIVLLIRTLIKPGARVTIAGGCDTSESEPEKLSLARATEVQKTLLNAAVPQSATITVSAKGTSQLRKATGPNVAEATNRNVLITID